MTNEFSTSNAEATMPSAEVDLAAPALAAPALAAPPVDAPVTVYGGLVFATTGPMACHELNAALDQVALTPSVALRIATVLRETLDVAEIREREHAVEVWMASEAAAMPRGRVIVSDVGIQFGIEPLGAGALVTVQWVFVPGLIASLENAADWLLSQR